MHNIRLFKSSLQHHFLKVAQAVRRTWDLFYFHLFSLNWSALDHSATAPPNHQHSLPPLPPDTAQDSHLWHPRPPLNLKLSTKKLLVQFIWDFAGIFWPVRGSNPWPYDSESFCVWGMPLRMRMSVPLPSSNLVTTDLKMCKCYKNCLPQTDQEHVRPI